jgi:hypothetical protein
VTPPTWRKSSRSSDGTSGQCVEVTQLSGTVGVRDSKQADTGHLSIGHDQFAALIECVKRSELEL